MVVHTLERHQTVHTDIETCWKFFSDPSNLAKITPSHLGFHIMSDLPPEIYEGLMIEYRVKPLLGIPLIWLTEISYVRRLEYFCDEQRVGPYSVWHHQHFFEPLDDNKVQMRDLVHYQLPLSPFSEVAHPLVVAPQLQEIFDYRIKAVEKIFPAG